MGRTKRPKNSVFRDILERQYDESAKYNLYKSVKGSEDWVQRLGLLKTLPIHSGCVNCICWNEKGDRLLSGSDDQHLIISHAYNYKILSNYKTSHRANIFSAKFLPSTNDTGIVSCSGDGMILYSDLVRLPETRNNIFNCHVGTTYEVATIPNDPYTFLSCGEDYTVRSFDLRTKEKCIKTRCIDVCNEDVIISCQRAVTALTVNSRMPYQLAIGCSDSTVRIYDRRMLTPSAGESAKPMMIYVGPGMEGRSYRITSLCYSPGGEDILVSYSSEHLYLFGVQSGLTTTLEARSTPAAVDEEPMTVEGTDSPVAPVRRLRLRGDWSDTGPDARPQSYSRQGNASQARPTLHGTLMQRMTDVLSRMLNDPATRAALSQGGEGAFPEGQPAPPDDIEEPAGQEADPSPLPPEAGLQLPLPPVPLEEEEEVLGDEEPLDLPLPSFSSTYLSRVDSGGQEEGLPGEEREGPSEADVAELRREEERPSTSRGGTSSGSNPGGSDRNSSHLQELSSAYNGIIEKHGVEPMVNLLYSDVGSTASSISVFVGDEVSRQQISQDDIHLPSHSSAPEGEVSTSTPERRTEKPPSPFDAEDMSHRELMSDDELMESDEDLSPVLRTECRLVHPIEKAMDDAIQCARSETSRSEEDDDCHKTRKSYIKQKYTGHRNARTMIKEAMFWGEDYVVSGSDCGHVFMWHRESGRLTMLLEADHHVVNCVQPHPHLPLLATSGIDYDVKLWAPLHEDSAFDPGLAEELMKRNAVMLEETKDTITVPASFMIRMLACLNQIRRGARARQQRRESTTNSD